MHQFSKLFKRAWFSISSSVKFVDDAIVQNLYKICVDAIICRWCCYKHWMRQHFMQHWDHKCSIKFSSLSLHFPLSIPHLGRDLCVTKKYTWLCRIQLFLLFGWEPHDFIILLLMITSVVFSHFSRVTSLANTKPFWHQFSRLLSTKELHTFKPPKICLNEGMNESCSLPPSASCLLINLKFPFWVLKWTLIYYSRTHVNIFQLASWLCHR